MVESLTSDDSDELTPSDMRDLHNWICGEVNLKPDLLKRLVTKAVDWIEVRLDNDFYGDEDD
jgi:hypothetical protein